MRDRRSSVSLNDLHQQQQCWRVLVKHATQQLPASHQIQQQAEQVHRTSPPVCHAEMYHIHLLVICVPAGLLTLPLLAPPLPVGWPAIMGRLQCAGCAGSAVAAAQRAVPGAAAQLLHHRPGPTAVAV
jgi:hypothetical protein